LGYRSEKWEDHRGMTQATYLPTAPPGIEPGLFSFKVSNVSDYTTGHLNWMPEQGLNLHFSVQSAATCH
jgi:hypothetical protein